MAMISADDLKRRDKLLGMLSSDFDGERATASAMLAKMAAGYKMTIPELCQATVSGAQSSRPQGAQAKPQPNTARPNTARPGNSTGPDNEMLMLLRKVIDHHLDLVTEWEEEFLENVTDKYLRDDDLSDKQRAVAMRILAKVAQNGNQPKRDGFRRYGA